VQLARAENVRGPLAGALEHASRAQDIFRDVDDLRGLATALRVTGDAFSRMRRFDEAAGQLRRGLELAERVGSIDEIGGCLINLGLAELGRADIPAAIACDRRAIEEFERIGHGTGTATAFGNLAEKLMHAGDYDEAIKFCGKALETGRSIGYSLIVAAATDTMAQILTRKGDFGGAAREAEEAGRLFLEMGAAPRAATSLEIAAKAWEGLGESERARFASERARSLVSVS
jgi:tetratricopeptide (TPR) repeat protein